MKDSKKVALKNLFNIVKHDCRSVTGRNLLNIMILTDKPNIDTLVPNDAMSIKYNEIGEVDAWRIGFVNELTDVKFGEAFVDGFSRKELEEILRFVCVT